MNEMRATQKPFLVVATTFLIVALALAAAWFLVSEAGGSVMAQEGGEPVDVVAQDIGGTIYLEPQHSYVNPGGTATVYVWLEDVGNIYGMDFQLSFEQVKVSIPSNKATLIWDVFDVDYHVTTRNIVTDVDATFDKLWYSISNLNPAEPFTGTGRLCSITFSGLVTGTTPLSFIYVKGVRKDGFNLQTAHVDGSITVGDPTAVTISQFATRPLGRSIRILWSTEQEIDLLGFNLYRAVGSDGEPLLLNETLIPSKLPGSPAGAQYAYADLTVESGVQYQYWLDFVHFDGTTTRYGPISATGLFRPGPSIQ